ncbi:MAG: phage portal protein [Kofleriaceae bacterium]|nr:MAG: phage portal protein [Kofleriaceae bacterium]
MACEEEALVAEEEMVTMGRLTLVKARILGSDVEHAPASHAPGEDGFVGTGAIEPPYDPRTLAELFEHASALRPNVDAYATNIDGFGHRLEPVIDFASEDAARKVKDALLIERAYRGDETDPSDDEVSASLATLSRAARAERARLDAFFEACCYDVSFIGLRRRTRQDLEVTGNAYWEVLRNGAGQIARFVFVPSYSVRLLPRDEMPVQVRERVRTSAIGLEDATSPRRLRRYVQVEGGPAVYFKQLGDPRVVSRKTGRVFATRDELLAADPTDDVANEMLHFIVPAPASPYGVPRWIGALLSVLGSREMEEVNLSYFSNKSVPPLAILVSGGRLADSSVPRIERFVDEQLKGKENFHKLLILEAETGPGTGENRAKIELRPLTDAQQKDGLFQLYDERNIDKVGATFRLPRILRGDGRESNRATADAALRFAEEQVFQPERDEFDHGMTQLLLNELGIRFWKFRSQAPIARDPERMTEMVERLVRVGVLTPEEGRHLAGDIFNREFRVIGDDWTKRPITLTLAGVQNGVQDLRGPVAGDLGTEAKRLLALRNELAAEEEKLAKRRLDLARRYLEEGTEVGNDNPR